MINFFAWPRTVRFCCCCCCCCLARLCLCGSDALVDAVPRHKRTNMLWNEENYTFTHVLVLNYLIFPQIILIVSIVLRVLKVIKNPFTFLRMESEKKSFATKIQLFLFEIIETFYLPEILLAMNINYNMHVIKTSKKLWKNFFFLL